MNVEQGMSNIEVRYLSLSIFHFLDNQNIY